MYQTISLSIGMGLQIRKDALPSPSTPYFTKVYYGPKGMVLRSLTSKEYMMSASLIRPGLVSPILKSHLVEKKPSTLAVTQNLDFPYESNQ